MGAAVFSALPPAGRTSLSVVPYSETLELYGIVLRREERLEPALFSPYKAEAGERLAAGDVPYPGAAELDESALFLPGSDGLEYLSPESAAELSPALLDELLASEKDMRRGPKLIYGFDFYYAAFLEGAEYLEPGPCRVKFEDFDESLSADILSVSREDERCALLLRVRMGSAELLELRICRAELIV